MKRLHSLAELFHVLKAFVNLVILLNRELCDEIGYRWGWGVGLIPEGGRRFDFSISHMYANVGCKLKCSA